MSARCSQPVAVSEVSRTIRTTHTTYGNPRLVVRVEVNVYRYWDSWNSIGNCSSTNKLRRGLRPTLRQAQNSTKTNCMLRYGCNTHVTPGRNQCDRCYPGFLAVRYQGEGCGNSRWCRVRISATRKHQSNKLPLWEVAVPCSQTSIVLSCIIVTSEP